MYSSCFDDTDIFKLSGLSREDLGIELIDDIKNTPLGVKL